MAHTNEQFSAEALDAERNFVEQEIEDQTDAINSLFEEEPAQEDGALTALLEPIGRASHTVTPVVQGPTDTVRRTIERGKSRVRHKVAAAIISILVVFGIGLGAGLFKSHQESEARTAAQLEENERKAAEAKAAQEAAEAEAEEARRQEAAHALRSLKFIISAAGYDSLSTRIPLVITGIDLDGAEVNQEAFINAEGEGVSLAPGEYSASIPASPINADGSMYKTPGETYSFKVPNNDQEVIQVDQAIVLIPLNAAELTEDIINNGYNWAVKDAQFASVAEANSSAAWKIREEELARKREEERRKQMEEQRAPLAQTFAQAYFTNVSFPDESDDSKVAVITNWSAVVGQYVASGSAAAGKIGTNPGVAYSFATRISAATISGDQIVVEVDIVSGNKVESGWTLNKSTKKITCSFDDNNKISDFTVS